MISFEKGWHVNQLVSFIQFWDAVSADPRQRLFNSCKQISSSQSRLFIENIETALSSSGSNQNSRTCVLKKNQVAVSQKELVGLKVYGAGFSWKRLQTIHFPISDCCIHRTAHLSVLPVKKWKNWRSYARSSSQTKTPSPSSTCYKCQVALQVMATWYIWKENTT